MNSPSCYLGTVLVGAACIGSHIFLTLRIRKNRHNIEDIPKLLACNESITVLSKKLGTIEVCLSDIDSACLACEHGATSIELCCDRGGGGVTPSIGLIKECVKRLKNKLEIHVLIRPRLGDFVYSDAEIEVMMSDIREAKSAGVDGVVVGILQLDNSVNVKQLHRMREASDGIQLTFHRAIDVCNNYGQALDIIMRAKCDRVLTSAKAATAWLGLPNLAKIKQITEGSIKLIAAAGISAETASLLIAGTGVDGVHAGSSVMSKKTNHQTLEGIEASQATMGSSKGEDDMSWDSVDPIKMKAFVSSATEGFRLSERNKIALPMATRSENEKDPDIYPSYF